MTVSNKKEGYEITFRGVKKFEIGEVESVQADKDMDIWGYSEILSADEKTLSFEVLFSSGMSFYVAFPNRGLKIRKLNSEPLQP